MGIQRDDNAMTLEELKLAEYIESCCDDGYGPRLRALRQELIRRLREAALKTAGREEEN